MNILGYALRAYKGFPGIMPRHEVMRTRFRFYVFFALLASWL